jgi:hypothetical protein
MVSRKVTNASVRCLLAARSMHTHACALESRSIHVHAWIARMRCDAIWFVLMCSRKLNDLACVQLGELAAPVSCSTAPGDSWPTCVRHRHLRLRLADLRSALIQPSSRRHLRRRTRDDPSAYLAGCRHHQAAHRCMSATSAKRLISIWVAIYYLVSRLPTLVCVRARMPTLLYMSRVMRKSGSECFQDNYRVK